MMTMNYRMFLTDDSGCNVSRHVDNRHRVAVFDFHALLRPLVNRWLIFEKHAQFFCLRVEFGILRHFATVKSREDGIARWQPAQGGWD
jgi:hypothetical protein